MVEYKNENWAKKWWNIRMAEYKIENQVKKWRNVRMKIGQKMTEFKNEN